MDRSLSQIRLGKRVGILSTVPLLPPQGMKVEGLALGTHSEGALSLDPRAHIQAWLDPFQLAIQSCSGGLVCAPLTRYQGKVPNAAQVRPSMEAT